MSSSHLVATSLAEASEQLASLETSLSSCPPASQTAVGFCVKPDQPVDLANDSFFGATASGDNMPGGRKKDDKKAKQAAAAQEVAKATPEKTSPAKKPPPVAPVEDDKAAHDRKVADLVASLRARDLAAIRQRAPTLGKLERFFTAFPFYELEAPLDPKAALPDDVERRDWLGFLDFVREDALAHLVAPPPEMTLDWYLPLIQATVSNSDYMRLRTDANNHLKVSLIRVQAKNAPKFEDVDYNPPANMASSQLVNATLRSLRTTMDNYGHTLVTMMDTTRELTQRQEQQMTAMVSSVKAVTSDFTKSMESMAVSVSTIAGKMTAVENVKLGAAQTGSRAKSLVELKASVTDSLPLLEKPEDDSDEEEDQDEPKEVVLTDAQKAVLSKLRNKK